MKDTLHNMTCEELKVFARSLLERMTDDQIHKLNGML